MTRDGTNNPRTPNITNLSIRSNNFRQIDRYQITGDEEGYLYNNLTTGEVEIRQQYENTTIDTLLANKADKDHTHDGSTISLTTSDVPEGSRLYFTNQRVEDNSVVQLNTQYRHTHINKALLDGLTDTGNGSKFLSDDGTYITIDISGIPNTTDDLPEGTTNLYFTHDRVDQNSNVSTNTQLRHDHSNKDVLDQLTQDDINNISQIPMTTDDLSEGSNNLYYTETRVSNNSDVILNTSYRHTHTNKTLLDSLIDTGSSTKFLSEDGSYYEIDITTIPQTTDDLPEGSTNLYYNQSYVSLHPDVIANTDARHTHTNITALDDITNSGDGSKFLANDGIYKTVDVSGIPNTTDDLAEGVNNLYYTDTRVSNNQDVVDNSDARHTHINKQLLDTLHKTGDGSKYLSDDGSYKTVDVSGIPNTTDDLPEGTTNLYYTDARFDIKYDAKIVNTSINLLSDVELNTLETDQILQFDGTKWRNVTISNPNGDMLKSVYDPNNIEKNVFDYNNLINKPTDLTDLSLHSSTELNDISDSGSGKIITDDERTKLTNIQDGAEVNVQSDWNVTDVNSDAFILNKPTIETPPTEISDLSDVDTSGAVNSDVLQFDGTEWKPATISTGGGDMLKSVYDPTGINADAFDYNNFTNTPTIPSTAIDVSYTPTGNISATNVQDAIDELDKEKEPSLSEAVHPKVGDTSTKSGIAGMAFYYKGTQTLDLLSLNSPGNEYLAIDVYDSTGASKETFKFRYYDKAFVLPDDTRVLSFSSDTTMNTNGLYVPNQYAVRNYVENYVSSADISESQITNLNRTRWYNKWSNIEYVKNDIVVEDGWLMIANNTTTDHAKPQTIGNPYYIYTGSNMTLTTHPNVVNSLTIGQQYEAEKDGYLTGYRLYIEKTTDYTYRLLYRDITDTNNIITKVGQVYTFETNGTKEISIDPIFLLKGHKFQFDLIIENHGSAPTDTVLNYNYQTPVNASDPGSGIINHANRENDILRVSKYDNDGNDQTTYLLSLKQGDKIKVDTLTWEIVSTFEKTNSVDITVTPAVQYGSDGVAAFTFSHYSPATIEYVKEDNYWSGRTDIRGLIQEDGFDNPTLDDHAYPIDLLVQEAIISPYWDFMATTSSIGGGSGGGATGDMQKAVYDPTNVEADAFDYNNFNNTPSDVTDLSIHSVTELNDVTNAGSGIIISDTERTKLNGIEEGAEVNTVDSVNSQTGSVVLDTDDINEGSNNLYYTDARVSSNVDVTDNTSARHTHTNKTTLDNIASSGSGNIITDTERDKLDNIEEGAQVNTVDSVNGKTGVVSLTTTDISEGTNQYFTQARVEDVYISYEDTLSGTMTFAVVDQMPTTPDPNTIYFVK